MHQTLVHIKDVEFVSYLRPSELHGHKATLQMSFRLPHMQEDEMIIDILKDEQNHLYTTNIDYYCARDEEQFSLLGEFDQEEMHELLKAVLNSDVTQKELTYYEMDDYVNCYAKPLSYDFAVVVTHAHLSKEESALPMDLYHQFSSKKDALDFFHTTVNSYKEYALEQRKQTFGAYQFIWQNPQTKRDIITYILLHHEGEEITSLDHYNSL